MNALNPWRLLLIACLRLAVVGAHAKTGKPNILVIWGDDIGWSNLSAYHRGMLGGSTPNIDCIANEGALFTDYYGEQSCTASFTIDRMMQQMQQMQQIQQMLQVRQMGGAPPPPH